MTNVPEKGICNWVQLSVVILVIAGIAFLGWAMFGDHSKHVVGAASHPFAPTQATGIEYFENMNMAGNVSVTYSVSENAFREFAGHMDWPLTERREITRVYSPSAFADKTFVLTSVDYCLFYKNRRPNGGGITVVYVPKDSRAYINKSNR